MGAFATRSKNLQKRTLRVYGSNEAAFVRPQIPVLCGPDCGERSGGPGEGAALQRARDAAAADRRLGAHYAETSLLVARRES